MKRLLVTAIVASIAAVPAAAQGFRTESHIRVFKGPGNSFSMETRRTTHDIWCAAGDYSLRVLGTNQSIRVIVETPKVRGNNTVSFTLDQSKRISEKGQITTASGKLRTQGASMSVGSAFQFCIDRREDVHR